MAKQIFVHKICKAGHDTSLAIEYIYQTKLSMCSDEVEVDEIVDLKLLEKIDPD